MNANISQSSNDKNQRSFARSSGFINYNDFFTNKSFKTLNVRTLPFNKFHGEYLMKYGLNEPIMIYSYDKCDDNVNKDENGVKHPSEPIDDDMVIDVSYNMVKLPHYDGVYELFDFICEMVGADIPIRVIDVDKQEDVPMKLGEYRNIYSHKSIKKIYNLISLEVSASRLSSRILAPKAVRDIDWIGKHEKYIL